MPVHLGSAAINAAYLGASAVDKIYLGANTVYTAIAPPAQVTGLAVDATGDGTIDLSWSAPASDATITDYSVEYTPSGGSATTVLVGSATTTYQLTGLTNDTEYSVRVAAVSAAGTGAYSAAVTGTPSAVVTDPDFANVALLMHMDGANGSTTFTDSSSYNRTLTANGNVSISAADSKFGGASCFFDGTGDYISVGNANGLYFGTNEFVIEMWVKFLSVADETLYDGRARLSSTVAPVVYVYNGSLEFADNNGNIAGGVTVTTGVWYYIAVAKDNGTTRMYLDGVKVGAELSDSSNYSLDAGHPYIGMFSPAQNYGAFHGYMDDLRVTNGSSRGYNGATIPVPTAPFPDA